VHLQPGKPCPVMAVLLLLFTVWCTVLRIVLLSAMLLPAMLLQAIGHGL